MQVSERVEGNMSSPVLLGGTEEDISTVSKITWSHFGVVPNPFLKLVQERGNVQWLIKSRTHSAV